MQQESSLISVLISTYNAADFIDRTIQNCLDQSYSNIEVLIVDDNSLDNTFSILEKRSLSDKRIKIYKNAISKGPYGSLNILLSKAKGKYIAIQDHDDYRDLDKLDIQVTFLQKNNGYLGCGTATKMLFEQDMSYFEYRFPKQTYYAVHPSLVFRAQSDLRYDTNEMYMGDAYFIKNILCRNKKVIYNLDTVLTTHIIKSNYSNASYSRFHLSCSSIKRLIVVHGYSLYTLLAFGFEVMRKLFYPLLKKIKAFGVILRLEKLPFRLSGYRFYNDR